MQSLEEFQDTLFYSLNYRFYKLRCKIKRWRIKNTMFTIISDNCLAGFLYHDMGQIFCSPLINGGLDCVDYLKFLKDMPHYFDQELVWIKGVHDFPYAKIDDIYYRFRHYKSCEDAEKKWKIRKTRINWDNLFVVLTEKDDCTIEIMEEFDRLPFKNKVILTHKPYPKIPCSRYIPGFEDRKCCGVLSEFKAGQYFGKRYYDGFDFVKWFNKK